jgi:hypothetical protein
LPDNWDEEFETPILLPSGGTLVTLRDAGRYIEALPKHEQASPAWKLATKELLRAAIGQLAWRWFARSAIMKALYGDVPAPITPKTRTADRWRGKRKARNR